MKKILAGALLGVASFAHASLAQASTVDQLTLNPWWPLVPGNQWVLKRADNGHPLTISVQPIQATFGCATNPVHLYFQKNDVDAYWGPGGASNLHWFLGVNPNGDILGYGHYTSDLSGTPTGDTMNYKSEDPTIPAYFLVPGNATNDKVVNNRHALPTATGITNNCIPDNQNYYSTWRVLWSFTNVTTPGYTGPALKASYDEQSGGRQIEDWYFAPGIGVVRIVGKAPDGTVGVDMVLDHYKLNDPSTIGTSPPPPIVPTASLAVGTAPNPPSGSQVITANVGDHLYYKWSSSQATSLSSYFFVDGPDGCTFGPSDVKKAWAAGSLSGTVDGVLASCQAGHTYTMVALAESSTGQITPSAITVHVNPAPPEPAPTASISLSGTGHVAYQAVNVGQNVAYYWNFQNASRVESYYYVDAPDHCSGGYGPNTLTLPWAVSSPAAGSVQAAAQSCQAGRSYTIVVTAYSPSGKQIARDQVIVKVNGTVYDQMDVAATDQAQNWWVWSYFYNEFSGHQTPPVESLVQYIDYSKLANLISLDAWYGCVANGNCAAMQAFYAPTTPAAIEAAIAAHASGLQTWDVWNWYYNAITGVSIAGPDSYVQVDSGKRSATLSLSDWWSCTQQASCANAAAVYHAPTQEDVLRSKASGPQTWDVWNWYWNQMTGVQIQGPEAYFSVNSSKRFNTIPVEAWWNCTQAGDCSTARSLIGQ